LSRVTFRLSGRLRAGPLQPAVRQAFAPSILRTNLPATFNYLAACGHYQRNDAHNQEEEKQGISDYPFAETAVALSLVAL